MTALVSVTAVSIEFVVPVEALTTEAAFRMPSEPTLVNGARHIIPELLMPAQFGGRKQFMLVCKDFFVASTEVTVKLDTVSTQVGAHTTWSSHV